MWAEKTSPVSLAKLSMSSSVTSRFPVSTASPISSSPKLLRNGCTSVWRRGAPGTHTPVTWVRVAGEPCSAVRCMKCSTPRMPPSSSPPPARPGPPWTRAGSGEPWPVDSLPPPRLAGRRGAWGRGAVAGRLLAAVAVGEQQPAVVAGHAERQLAREPVVVGEDRADQAAAAALGQLDRLLRRVVRHQRADRPEGLDLVDLRCAARLVAAQQDRVEERALLGIGPHALDPVQAPRHDLGHGREVPHPRPHLLTLL